jgi:DNA-binding response OmpR family regulator
VLVIDGTERKRLAQVLRATGAVATVVDTLTAVVGKVTTWRPDVVIITGISDGPEICAALRQLTDAYLAVVSIDEDVRVAALRAGADDALHPGMSGRVLAARIYALQRRPRSLESKPTSWRVGDLTIDPDARIVRQAGQSISLTKTEFDLLAALVSRAGTAVSRNELVGDVLGRTTDEDAHLLDVHISNLRRKLGEEGGRPRYLVTVRGVGFRFEAA